MDSDRIDGLARSLARRQSRRSFLASAVSAAICGAIGAPRAEAATACVSPGRVCRADRPCCAGSVCDDSGRCACAGGLTLCDRVCVDPVTFASDKRNCGACGARCYRSVCQDGRCVKENGRRCAEDEECASGQCVSGICCDRACIAPCETCAARGSVGACIAVASDIVCEPEDLCYAVGTCQEGICVPGEPLDCDDGNICTVDWCDPVRGCLHRPDWPGTPCGDGLNCCSGECVPKNRNCIRAYSLCSSPEHCRANCCSGTYDEMGEGDYIVRTCSRAFLGGRCGGSGLECYPGAGSCVCGRCCLPFGSYAQRASDCCSLVIDPSTGTCR